MLVVFIVSFSVAVVVSAMCSVAESVLLSLSTAQLVEIAKVNPRIGKIWEDFKKDVNAPVTAILTLNTAAHTIGASFAGASFAQLTGDKWVGAFSLAFTFVMLQFTEILPKTLGVRFNYNLAFVIASPLSWVTYLSQPLFYLFRILNRPFEPKADKAEAPLGAVQEIMLLTSLARSQKQLDVEQERIILAALRLSSTAATDVMVPINEVSMFSDSMSVLEALEIGNSDSHTRFPVYYKNDPSLIIGYVNLKELIGRDVWSTKEDNKDVSDETNEVGLVRCLRKITHVEPDAKASDVLSILVKQHEHIALVIRAADQKALGILTLEDLVEEIVGEIEDEFDRLPDSVHVSKIYVRVGGGTPLKSVAARVKELFGNDSDELIADFEKFDISQRFTNWFEERNPDGVAKYDCLDFGPLAVWIRRARRDQVFDAQIQRVVTKPPRITVTTKSLAKPEALTRSDVDSFDDESERTSASDSADLNDSTLGY